jgi:hypothetical protein
MTKCGSGLQQHSIAAAQYRSIAVSQYHSITVSQYRSITVSQYHSIAVSQQHSITVSQLPADGEDTETCSSVCNVIYMCVCGTNVLKIRFSAGGFLSNGREKAWESEY